MTFSEVLDAVLIGLLRNLWGPTSVRKHLPKLEGAAMKPTDAERFEKLAEAYRPNADYCRHMAAGAGKHSSKAHWVRLAASWIKLGAACSVLDQIGESGKGQGRVALDRACLSVTQN